MNWLLFHVQADFWKWNSNNLHVEIKWAPSIVVQNLFEKVNKCFEDTQGFLSSQQNEYNCTVYMPKLY